MGRATLVQVVLLFLGYLNRYEGNNARGKDMWYNVKDTIVDNEEIQAWKSGTDIIEMAVWQMWI